MSEAKTLLERALAIDPKRAECLVLLADVCYVLERDNDTSILLLERVVAIEPSWLWPRVRLMRALRDAGRVSLARQQAERVLAISQPHEEAFYPDITQDFFERSITGRQPLTRWGVKNSATRFLKELDGYRDDSSIIRINMRDLRVLCGILLAYLEKLRGPIIEIVNSDKYWKIDASCNVYEAKIVGDIFPTSGSTCGLFGWEQLSSIVFKVNKLATKDADPFYGDLDNVGELLERICDFVDHAPKTVSTSGAEPIIIDFVKVRFACSAALTNLELYGVDAICFSPRELDSYRYLPSSEIYDATFWQNDPKDTAIDVQVAYYAARMKELFAKLQIGSVVADWRDLEKLLLGQEEARLAHMAKLGRIFHGCYWLLREKRK